MNKGLLKYDDGYVMPITRGELVLDSSGNQALRSDLFLAGEKANGLMSATDKKNLDALVDKKVHPLVLKINSGDDEGTDLYTYDGTYSKTLNITGGNNIKVEALENNLSISATYEVVSEIRDGLAPKITTKDTDIIKAQANEWVLTSEDGKTPTWRKLPVNAFKNDNINTTYSLSGAISGNNYTVILTDSDSTTSTATVPVMTGATTLAAGKAGLVPAPTSANAGKFLKGDGTWATPTNTWVANSKDTDGYVLKGSGQANKVWKTDNAGNPGWRQDSDHLVTQLWTEPKEGEDSNNNNNYHVLFSENRDTSDKTEQTRKSSYLRFNPYTGKLLVNDLYSTGAHINTQNNTTPLLITRGTNTNDEILKIGIDDLDAVFDYTNSNEGNKVNSFVFNMHNAGNSKDKNGNTIPSKVTFRNRDSKSSVIADAFIGPATALSYIYSQGSDSATLKVTQEDLNMNNVGVVVFRLNSQWANTSKDGLTLSINDVSGKVTLSGQNIQKLLPGTYALIYNGSTYTILSTSVHVHQAGVGLSIIGENNITSGIVNYKAKLKSETASLLDSGVITDIINRQYAVGVDKSGYLSVNVPWTDTKNTAGSTNDKDKMYLIGAKSQSANPQTYSNSAVYATNGVLCADGIVSTALSSTDNKIGIAMQLRNKGWVSNMQTAIDFYNGSKYTVPQSRISTLMDGNGNAGGTLIFSTQTKHDSVNPNDNALVERMRIDDKGLVTINGNLTVTGDIKLGSQTVGSESKPIYLNKGEATVCANIDNSLISKSVGESTLLKWDSEVTLATIAGCEVKATLPKQPSDIKVQQTEKSDTGAYPLLLGPSSHTSGKAAEAYYDSGVTLNPHTNTIKANISGIASQAERDTNNNKIVDTYATKTELNSKANATHNHGTITLTGAVTGSGTITGSDEIKITATVVDDSHNHTNLGTETKGSATQPIYLNSGKPNTCTVIAAGSGITSSATGLVQGKAVYEYAAPADHTHNYASFAFKTINCHRGSDPVADAVDDTLTLADDGYIIVTGDVTENKITFEHATPTTNTDSTLTATASGGAAEWSIDVVQGVTLQRDAKGHVTGVSVTSGKLPDNPNTNTAHSHAVGVGLTVEGTDNTTSGTVTYTMKTAATGEIGGVKIAKDNSSYAVTTQTSEMLADVTSGKYYGVEIDKNDKAFVYVPWTDTNTKVTSVGNHYTPAYNPDSTLSATGDTLTDIANSSSGVPVVTGLQRDAKGHVVGVNSVALKSTNTTYELVSASNDGLMSKDDKAKLDGIANGANNYVLPVATSSTIGGIKIGYTQSDKNYPVKLSNEQAYVEVPWTDRNVQYSKNSQNKECPILFKMPSEVTTGIVYYSEGQNNKGAFFINPGTKTLTSENFAGNLIGNADSATCLKEPESRQNTFPSEVADKGVYFKRVYNATIGNSNNIKGNMLQIGSSEGCNRLLLEWATCTQDSEGDGHIYHQYRWYGEQTTAGDASIWSKWYKVLDERDVNTGVVETSYTTNLSLSRGATRITSSVSSNVFIREFLGAQPNFLNQWMLQFTTSDSISSICSLETYNDVKWANDEPPLLEGGYVYEIIFTKMGNGNTTPITASWVQYK